MVFPKARLAVSAGLFLAWIGYLAYLVAHTRDPVILSRPQLAVASLVVVATVEDNAGKASPTVAVKKVVWSVAGADGQPAQVTVVGLTDCGASQGWRGAGDYILPLTKRDAQGGYEVTPLPLSPGYAPVYVTVELERVGPNKEEVAKLWATLTGSAEGKEALAAGQRRRNVPRHVAEDVRRKLENVQATARLIEGEGRIYLATPDALEQLEELKPK